MQIVIHNPLSCHGIVDYLQLVAEGLVTLSWIRFYAFDMPRRPVFTPFL
jgi:hypothetical protein